MNDLISRQAAIDAVRGSIWAQNHIKNLPSVQPVCEPCEDAISKSHFDERVRLAGGMANEELTQDFKDGVLTVLEMLKTEPSIRVQPAQKEGKWIPHEVKLPDRTILNYTCSACGRKLIGYGTETLSEVPYCHCGAKMKGGE